MNMKTTFRHALIFVMAIFMCSVTINAATIYVDGIKYTTSGAKATVAKYDAKTGGEYKGVIVIPETITSAGKTYTVTGTGANSFVNCIEVTNVTLPNTCVSIGRNSFKGCAAMTNFPMPATATSIGQGAFDGCALITEAFIPSGCTAKIPMIKDEFNGCTSLKKFTIQDSEEEIVFAPEMFGAVKPPIEDLYIGRNISTKYKPGFAGMSTIKKLVIGDKVTTISAGAFANISELIDLTIGNGVTTMEASAFANCSKLTSVVIPVGITAIPSQAFSGCRSLKDAKMSGNVTSIGAYAFNACPLELNGFPMGVQTIGAKAFYKGAIATTLTLPEGLTSIGEKAFFGCNLKNIEIPASVTSIGEAAFGTVNATSIKVAPANTVYKSTDDILYTVDGKAIIAIAPASATLVALKNFTNATVETVMQYGLALAPFEKIELANLKSIEEHAFFATPNLSTFTVNGATSLGTYAFENSGVKTITIGEGIRTIQSYFAQGCSNLTSVTLPKSLNVIMLNAFKDCSALKSIIFEHAVNYIEAGAIPSTIEEITCKNINVPIISGDLFNEAMSTVKCKVAESAVADYKAAAGWKFLNIIGDPSITGKKQELGCPTGLYFATKAGELKYLDAQGNIQDTGIPSGLHAFQLGAAHNRIYVGYAGDKFTYQDPKDTQGDGELFYLNKSGDSFYRVTLVSNIGYNAFEDVFSMSVDAPAHKLLVADRNVGIHLIDTETPGLYGQQPFLTQNDWLAYYNKGITWGAIGCGMIRDSKNVYWMGKKFNGNGIFRFKESDIYPEKNYPVDIPYPVLFEGVSMTTFYIDEENGFLYAYLQLPTSSDKTSVPGIYRFSLADIEANQAQTSFAVHGTLIDDSPVKKEGSSPNELTGITQISGNGENIYWAYIAPAAGDTEIIGAKPLDETNPLHKSGIKTISAKGGEVTVSYAVKDVEAYGVVAAKYTKPAGVEDNVSDKVQTKCIVKGSQVDVNADAKVRIISINGSICGETMISGNGTVSVANLSKGMYLIHVMYTDGSAEVVKVIR